MYLVGARYVIWNCWYLKCMYVSKYVWSNIFDWYVIFVMRYIQGILRGLSAASFFICWSPTLRLFSRLKYLSTVTLRYILSLSPRAMTLPLNSRNAKIAYFLFLALASEVPNFLIGSLWGSIVIGIASLDTFFLELQRSQRPKVDILL